MAREVDSAPQNDFLIGSVDAKDVEVQMNKA